MENRFNFRAWSFKEYEMLYDVQKECNYTIDKDMQNFNDYLEDDEYIVMQSTGLTDKNSKLIFEGDNLKDKQDKIWVIVYNFGSFILQNTKNLYEEIEIRKIADEIIGMKIIGNIYENKELIGK